MGVTSLGPHTGPACYEALLEICLIKKQLWIELLCVCLFFFPWGHVMQIPLSDWSIRAGVQIVWERVFFQEVI